MTKKEFLKLPIWNMIPDNAEIIGTVFSIVKHLDDHKPVKANPAQMPARLTTFNACSLPSFCMI